MESTSWRLLIIFHDKPDVDYTTLVLDSYVQSLTQDRFPQERLEMNLKICFWDLVVWREICFSFRRQSNIFLCFLFFLKGLSFQICFILVVHKNNTHNNFKILELFTIAAGKSSPSTHFCKWCKLCNVIIEFSQGQNISQTCFVWLIEWGQRRKFNIVNTDYLTWIFPTARQILFHSSESVPCISAPNILCFGIF